MHPISPGSRIGQGRTAEIYSWQEGEILKLFYAGCPPGTAEIEMMIGRAIAGRNLPTPKLIGMVEIDGRKGLIFERVEGMSMLK